MPTTGLSLFHAHNHDFGSEKTGSAGLDLHVSIQGNDYITCDFKRNIEPINEQQYGKVFPLDQPYNPAWAAGPSTEWGMLDYHKDSKIVYNEKVRMTDVIPVISLDECGKSKGCLMNPPDCNSTENCQQIVTFQVSPNNSSRIRFEMYSSNAYQGQHLNYIAFGLTPNRNEFMVIFSYIGNFIFRFSNLVFFFRKTPPFLFVAWTCIDKMYCHIWLIILEEALSDWTMSCKLVLNSTKLKLEIIIWLV